ncbi:MAG: DNA polymerase III subunit beta [Deltaproteobacteria bacterium]|nr:DNA polymerase III subunit beta [Deltaproteobacteria bacterium]
MKLHIEKDALLQGTGRTQGVIDRRGTMPILSHCLLEAEGDQLKISATDYEVSFRGYYPAQVLENGGQTVPAINFFNIVKEMPAGQISIESTDTSNLILSRGDTRYKFLGLPMDNFPPLPNLEDRPMVTVKNAVLREMLEKTIFSIATEDLQQHLTGVFCERVPDSNKLRLVSSDGHRLSLIDREFLTGEEFELEQGILIPRKGVTEILRLLAEEGECALGREKKNLVLKQGLDYLYVRLLEKKFPDYHRIIPGSPHIRLAINRKALLEILKRISLLSTEKFKGVLLRVSDGWLDIRYQNPEVGGGDERLPVTVTVLTEVEEPEPEKEEDRLLAVPFEVSYNARYLMEPLSVMQSEEVYLELTKKKKPVCLRDARDPDYLSIVMPMDL